MAIRLRRAKPPAQLRTTTVPFREWPWRARVIEKLYRLTHGGQIRTLVVSRRPR